MTDPTLEVFAETLEQPLIEAFYFFLLSSSLLEAKQLLVSLPGLSEIPLKVLRDWAGTNLLKRLERHLNAKALASHTKPQLECLYLIVLGTIVSMNCNLERCTKSCWFNSDGPEYYDQKRSLDIIRLLAHYLAYLGTKLTILADDTVAKTLLDHARCNFHLSTDLRSFSPHSSVVNWDPEIMFVQQCVAGETNSYFHNSELFTTDDTSAQCQRPRVLTLSETSCGSSRPILTCQQHARKSAGEPRQRLSRAFLLGTDDSIDSIESFSDSSRVSQSSYTLSYKPVPVFHNELDSQDPVNCDPITI